MKTDTLDSSIGNRIRQLRRSRHMTQDQLAELLDVSIKHISTVERGVARLSLEKMISLCDILDTGMDYLVLGRTPAGNGVPIPQFIIETLNSEDASVRQPLIEYLNLYERINRGR